MSEERNLNQLAQAEDWDTLKARGNDDRALSRLFGRLWKERDLPRLEALRQHGIICDRDLMDILLGEFTQTYCPSMVTDFYFPLQLIEKYGPDDSARITKDLEIMRLSHPDFMPVLTRLYDAGVELNLPNFMTVATEDDRSCIEVFEFVQQQLIEKGMGASDFYNDELESAICQIASLLYHRNDDDEEKARWRAAAADLFKLGLEADADLDGYDSETLLEHILGVAPELVESLAAHGLSQFRIDSIDWSEFVSIYGYEEELSEALSGLVAKGYSYDWSKLKQAFAEQGLGISSDPF